MTTWHLIRAMVQKGYTFEMGRHCDDIRGYWASFYVDPKNIEECDECGQFPDRSWNQSGHAMTPHRAVVMAAKVALNKITEVPSMDIF